MKFLVDANILFAALIKESLTTELLISDKFELYAPEFLLEEFSKYENIILKKTHQTKEEFINFLTLLKKLIIIIPQDVIFPFLNRAKKFSPDKKDTIYLATVLAINAQIWSNDKQLKKSQNKVKVFSTQELIDTIGFFKN